MFPHSGSASLRIPSTMIGALLIAMSPVTHGAEETQATPQYLAGTRLLKLEGDIAAHMIAGADRFLLYELEASIGRRAKFWNRDTSSSDAYNNSVDPNRRRIAAMIGVRDPRAEFASVEFVATVAQPAVVGRGDGYEIYAIRWPALDGVYGEGLLLEPTGKPPIAQVVAIPDCEQTPEALAGLVEGVPVESQFARRLAESGCRVVIPVLINPKDASGS